MLLPDILHADIVDYEGERDGAGRVCPEARGVFVGAYPWGARTGFSFVWVRTPAWGRPYIPFRISKKTQPLGVTKCCKLYSSINSSGIWYVWTRKLS